MVITPRGVKWRFSGAALSSILYRKYDARPRSRWIWIADIRWVPAFASKKNSSILSSSKINIFRRSSSIFPEQKILSCSFLFTRRISPSVPQSPSTSSSRLKINDSTFPHGITRKNPSQASHGSPVSSSHKCSPAIKALPLSRNPLRTSFTMNMPVRIHFETASIFHHCPN